MRRPPVHGIVSCPVTPFHRETCGVDLITLGELIERLIQTGSRAIAPLSGAGEAPSLTDREWHEVAEQSLAAVACRVPTLVGVSAPTTTGTVRRARAAADYGADAVLVLPMSGGQLSERELATHLGAVCTAVDIPVMIDNNPAAGGVDMVPEFLVQLTEQHQNITMITESTGDIGRMQRITQLCDDQLPVFNGSDRLAYHAMAAGAAGWCTAAPCALPLQCRNLWDTAQAGDFATARARFHAMLPVLELLRRGGLPQSVKAGLRLLGFDAGVPRPPLLELEETEAKQLAQLLAQLGEDAG